MSSPSASADLYRRRRSFFGIREEAVPILENQQGTERHENEDSSTDHEETTGARGLARLRLRARRGNRNDRRGLGVFIGGHRRLQPR